MPHGTLYALSSYHPIHVQWTFTWTYDQFLQGSASTTFDPTQYQQHVLQKQYIPYNTISSLPPSLDDPKIGSASSPSIDLTREWRYVDRQNRIKQTNDYGNNHTRHRKTHRTETPRHNRHRSFSRARFPVLPLMRQHINRLSLHPSSSATTQDIRYAIG